MFLFPFLYKLYKIRVRNIMEKKKQIDDENVDKFITYKYTIANCTGHFSNGTMVVKMD